jgi:predicted Ser/Thr protein kinase
MAAPLVCPQCGSEIPSGAPAGLCPKCLVLAGLESQPPADPKRWPTQPSPPAGSSGFVPPAAEELAARLPQLEILGMLGRGGMGAVYMARQPQLDRLVALKILPVEGASDPAFAERFAREARALARLNHPNIVAVYDFGRTADGLFYFVMEYVDGVNLRQALQSGGMNPQEALAIVPQICDALQFAHEEGIVHRDIKPENILIAKRGRVKIADFGLAKLLGQEAADRGLTGTQQVMGTLHYMAPEQMEGAKAVDHRADIYSLGVVFYELLTGELPIGRFAPPSKKVEIDVRLDEVVLRALEKEPEQRYQHASEVKTGIEQASLVRQVPRPKAPGATGGPSADLLPRLTVVVISGVLGGLSMAAGAALAAFAVLTESPASGPFWGWMGGAFGCFFGGGGGLIGAINGYRQLAGAEDLMTVAGWTWFDRILVGYGLCGGAALATALAWGSLASPARWSIGLLGAIMVGQAVLFLMLRWPHRRRGQSDKQKYSVDPPSEDSK